MYWIIAICYYAKPYSYDIIYSVWWREDNILPYKYCKREPPISTFETAINLTKAKRLDRLPDQALILPYDSYVANLKATFTPCELAFFKAVLRTVFCLRQNARGAIFAASLTNEFVDSALLDYHDCIAIISSSWNEHFIAKPCFAYSGMINP